MGNKNILIIIAGFISLFTFILHLTAGQIDLMNPLLESSLNIEVKSQLVGVWNMVSLIIIVTSIVTLKAGFKAKTMNIGLVSAVGYLNLFFVLPFLLSGFYYGVFAPQWVLFLPIGVLTLIGVRRVKVSADLQG